MRRGNLSTRRSIVNGTSVLLCPDCFSLSLSLSFLFSFSLSSPYRIIHTMIDRSSFDAFCQRWHLNLVSTAIIDLSFSLFDKHHNTLDNFLITFYQLSIDIRATDNGLVRWNSYHLRRIQHMQIFNNDPFFLITMQNRLTHVKMVRPWFHCYQFCQRQMVE